MAAVRRHLAPLLALALLAAILMAAGTAEALPPVLDGDGDGWANPIETLLGSDAGDPFKTPESFAIPASCMDGADNDGDGATDDADPGCHPIPVIRDLFPPAGFDVFESEMTLRGLELRTPSGRCAVDFEGVGPTVVRRGNPQNSGSSREIDVEIVAMQLTGTANLLPGSPCNRSQRVQPIPLTIVEDPGKASSGKVTGLTPRGDFPADSFFDVNFQVDTPLGLLPGSLRVENDRINTLPPFHTPNDPATNPDCYEFGGIHEHCPKPPLDHFLCYSGDFDPFSERVRLMRDQFIGTPVKVSNPDRLCTPVAKNRLPIFDEGAHLQRYELGGALPNIVTGTPVVVRNQFGTQTFQLGRRSEVLVPAEKRAGNQTFVPLALDHYTCYEVTGNQLNRPVALRDQFGSANTIVSRPLRLCNPTAKFHDGRLTRVVDKRWHLVCYAIAPFALLPQAVTVKDQFRTAPVTVRRPDSLCVPSQKFFERFPPRTPHTVGLVDPSQGRWFLRDLAGNVRNFFFGNPGDVPFMGDWDCDGDDTPGLYRQRDGFVYLRNSNDVGIADIRFFFGDPGDEPIAGDFDNDGCDTVSIYRPSEHRFYIINELGENNGGLGAADFSFVFGNPGDKPVVGDWDGDGTDELGLHRESTGLFYWRETLKTGIADGTIIFGDPGDRFVAGDWGVVDGKDTPAVFRPSNSRVFLRDTLTQGVADEDFAFGEGTFLPVSGNFRLG